MTTGITTTMPRISGRPAVPAASTRASVGAEIPSAPFEFFDLNVVRTERLGHSIVRITFGGEGLAGFATGGRDQRFKLFLPHAHQDAPVLPDRSADTWYAAWREMDPRERAIMRSYTVAEQRCDPNEIDVDFVVHDDPGPAASWAAGARPGDTVPALGPTSAENGGVDFRPPAGTEWVLLAADATALPAVAGILAWLPAGAHARVWIEVRHTSDIRRLPTAADAEISWLVRDRPSHHHLVDAVRTANLPRGTAYAWLAGEAGAVRGLRRHLIGERGVDRRAVRATGYWRRGATEEDLLAEVVSGAAADRTGDATGRTGNAAGGAGDAA